MLFKDLFDNFSQPGPVEAICIRPARREAAKSLDSVLAVTNTGLAEDRYRNTNGPRQVTLIQHEHVKSIASFLGRPSIEFTLFRRNIIVRGINLLSLKGKKFQIGEALLEFSGECHLCSRMEETLGPGGYNAMRGLGGITARIIEGGQISVGDSVTVIH